MLEIIEIMSDPQDYVVNLSNRIELPASIIGVIYSILRSTRIDKNFYPHNQNPDKDEKLYIIFIILNLVISISVIYRILSFLKISFHFGILVQLFINSFNEILTFIIFMFIVLLFNSHSYSIIGAEISDEDYPELEM